MMFQDYLFYGTDVETRYAFRMLHLTTLVRHAQALHGLTGRRAEVLGEGLLTGVLLASILEDEERINLRVQASSDFTMGIETTRHAVTRGYLECNSDSSLIKELDAGLQPALPLVVRSLRSKTMGGHLFEGVSGTETNSLQTAFNDHLQASYQMKSQIRIDCWHDSRDNQLYAVGVIYLELPHLKQDVARDLWSHVNALPALRTLFGHTAHDPDVLSAHLIPHQVRAINSINPAWGCSCSQDSVERMLMKLGHDELVSMADERKPAEIRCHYCNKFYLVNEERLRALAHESDMNASSKAQNTLLN